ncbi:hypothetical protein I3842_10G049700 [Carya illinoinensis]|uniref:Uncharacterized protein n=1 Tax=Carya illinoinensis TaxID=32201 RepID=A0A922DVN1_CARIL|nr:hypothetical protein I3842_10G049700 [Carya illinoinensis]
MEFLVEVGRIRRASYLWIEFSPSQTRSSPTVLSIECPKGSSKANEWTCDFLQIGDIVEELRIGNSSSRRMGTSGTLLLFTSSFKNSKSGVQMVLHDAYKKKETLILV